MMPQGLTTPKGFSRIQQFRCSVGGEVPVEGAVEAPD